MSSDVREDDKIVDGFSVSVIWPLAVAASGDAGWPDHRGENIVDSGEERRKKRSSQNSYIRVRVKFTFDNDDRNIFLQIYQQSTFKEG